MPEIRFSKTSNPKNPENPRTYISSCDPTTESEPNRNRPVHQRHHPANLSPVAHPKADPASSPVRSRTRFNLLSLSAASRRVVAVYFLPPRAFQPNVYPVCLHFPPAATSDIFSSAVGQPAPPVGGLSSGKGSNAEGVEQSRGARGPSTRQPDERSRRGREVRQGVGCPSNRRDSPEPRFGSDPSASRSLRGLDRSQLSSAG
ncbi:hypothetical protein K0M31_000289 [Melipona bicolor]|uniref:Uncharacterized protein n=1 Tax=Melipona bicolor TaxID=60889 RepID=A0AA40GDF8_9HYME|nr:hypothetical protein K0M31_000289 [Melipona bicolor]